VGRVYRVVLLAVLASWLIGCMVPESIEQSRKTGQTLMQDKLLSSKRLQTDGVDSHYVVRQNNTGNLVVFIHGTPGDWHIFSPQFSSPQLASVATLVGLDRPGWGLSTLANSARAPTLAQQSALIGPVLRQLREHYPTENLVLVGHSLGGSLVPLLAMDHPGVVDAVVVLAGDLSIQYPAAYWYNSLADWRVMKWLIPESMAKANDEVLALEQGLASMMDRWSHLEVPLLVVQGHQDGLVDPRHADFAESLTTKSEVRVVRVEDGGHMVHLSHVDMVNSLIAQVVDRAQTGFFAAP